METLEIQPHRVIGTTPKHIVGTCHTVKWWGRVSTGLSNSSPVRPAFVGSGKHSSLEMELSDAGGLYQAPAESRRGGDY